MKKRFWLQISILLIFLTVTNGFAEDDHLSAVKTNRILYFGVAPDFFPFVYHNEAGELTGLDIDLMQEIGRRMGVAVENIEIAYEGLPAALAVHQVDVIGGALEPGEMSSEMLDFSRIYFLGNYGLMILGNSEILDSIKEEDLYWMRLGVEKGGAMDQFVKTKLIGRGLIDFQQVIYFDTVAEAVDALNWNEVDLILMARNTYKRQYEIDGSYRFISAEWLKENYAFASYKGSNLIPEINRLLDLIMADGTAQKLAGKYGNLISSHPIAVSPDRPEENQEEMSSAKNGEEPCLNAMRFLADVTVPDGTKIPRDSEFEKTWRVYNIGTCTWTKDYFLKYKDGASLGVQRIPVVEEVRPGSDYEFTAVFKTPSETGMTRTSWQMMTPEGKSFGQTIWVNIEVTDDGLSKSN